MGFPQVWIRDQIDEIESSVLGIVDRVQLEGGVPWVLGYWGPGFNPQNPTKITSLQYPSLTVTDISHWVRAR